jgi:hypothetical protein
MEAADRMQQMEADREQQAMQHEADLAKLQVALTESEMKMQTIREKAAIDITVARHKQALAMKPKPQPQRASA